MSLSETALKPPSANLFNRSCAEERPGFLHITGPCLSALTVQIHNVIIILWRQSLHAGRGDATELELSSRDDQMCSYSYK